MVENKIKRILFLLRLSFALLAIPSIIALCSCDGAFGGLIDDNGNLDSTNTDTTIETKTYYPKPRIYGNYQNQFLSIGGVYEMDKYHVFLCDNGQCVLGSIDTTQTQVSATRTTEKIYFEHPYNKMFTLVQQGRQYTILSSDDGSYSINFGLNPIRTWPASACNRQILSNGQLGVPYNGSCLTGEYYSPVDQIEEGQIYFEIYADGTARAYTNFDDITTTFNYQIDASNGQFLHVQNVQSNTRDGSLVWWAQNWQTRQYFECKQWQLLIQNVGLLRRKNWHCQ